MIRKIPSDAPDPHRPKRWLSRVGQDEKGVQYIWMWGRDGVGWVRANDLDHLIRLLAEPPYEGAGR